MIHSKLAMMRKLCITLLALCFVMKTFSQDSLQTNKYYLQRSKQQKSIAKILLIGGGVITVLGIALSTSKQGTLNEFNSGALIASIGTASMIGSIPLFSAASRNKRKANLMIGTVNTPLVIPFGIGKKLIKLGIAISI